jgi:hypothetical protein
MEVIIAVVSVFSIVQIGILVSISNKQGTHAEQIKQNTSDISRIKAACPICRELK